MVFSSLSFIFLFIPITVLFYFVSKNRVWRNFILLISSLVFYSWGEPKLVLLMLLVTVIAYVGGLLIEKFKDRQKLRKTVYILTLVLLTANLIVFKYLGFIETNIEGLLGTSLNWPALSLPIGISFYTFQILSYVIDLYRGNVKVQNNFFYLLLYLCFFPQLIAGPIVRYSTVEEEIKTRNESSEDIAEGIRRFIVGLAKKVIISNGVAKFAEIVYEGDPNVYGSAMYWLAAVAYSLQLYFDFSGYSDMAIGLGRIFGFHFLENFDHPYLSTSITEFWRRWHISLSSWFRDYVYIPLGGSRVGKIRWIFNIMVVWALTGLWHGASWNFVFWGMFYGILLALEKLLTGRLMEKLPKLVSWAITMFIVVLGWVLFNITDLAQLTSTIKVMFGGIPTSLLKVIAANTGIIEAALYLPLGIIFMFPAGKLFSGLKNKKAGLVLTNLWHFILLGICAAYLISNKYNPFIYFRF